MNPQTANTTTTMEVLGKNFTVQSTREEFGLGYYHKIDAFPDGLGSNITIDLIRYTYDDTIRDAFYIKKNGIDNTILAGFLDEIDRKLFHSNSSISLVEFDGIRGFCVDNDIRFNNTSNVAGIGGIAVGLLDYNEKCIYKGSAQCNYLNIDIRFNSKKFSDLNFYLPLSKVTDKNNLKKNITIDVANIHPNSGILKTLLTLEKGVSSNGNQLNVSGKLRSPKSRPMCKSDKKVDLLTITHSKNGTTNALRLERISKDTAKFLGCYGPYNEQTGVDCVLPLPTTSTAPMPLPNSTTPGIENGNNIASTNQTASLLLLSAFSGGLILLVFFAALLYKACYSPRRENCELRGASVAVILSINTQERV